jgi:P4 family phage/plasmid primase-like protien
MMLNKNNKDNNRIYQKGDILKYLKPLKAAKNADFTHTSMGNPSGSYYIQAENNDEFLNIYASAIKNNEVLHITEKHKLISPILLDFDFRFNINENLERLYNYDNILEILNIYTTQLDNYIDNTNYNIYILEKENPSILKDNIGKDGIHIMIPEIVTKPSIQYILRDNCLKEMEIIFKKIGFTNTVEDIFDECVIEKNNWLMYGSSKPDKEPYKVTKIYNYNNNCITEVKEQHNIEEYAKLFSIRNKNKPNNLKFEKENEIAEYNEFLMDKEREKLTFKQILKSTRNTKKNKDVDIELIRKIVKILDPRRSQNFDDWIRLGWCLRNIDHRLLEDWIEFSKNSPKYSDGECENKWNYMKDANLGQGTLRMWAQQDNSKAYLKILQEDLHTLMTKAKSATHTDIAHVIYQMFKYEFVCSNIKKNVWWQFKDHRWRETDSGVGLRIKMSSEVYKQFLRLANDNFSRALQIEDDDDEVERLKKLGDKYSKIANSLKNQTQKSNYLKECSELFYHDKFEEKLDSKCTIIGFKNGVFDLETYEFRDGHPDDFLSFSTNIDYVKYDDDSDVNAEIMDFIDKILPKEEMKTYLLKLFSSFLSGHIKDEKFHIFTGTGANGKSKIIELFQSSFGDYCGQFNVSLLTQKRVKSNETNSELAQSKGKRFMVLQEPCENEKINTGFMKELTGGDTIVCRGLFKDPISFKPQAHMVLTCNHLPNIPSDDGGTWRRLRVIEYSSKFTDNPNPNNNKEFKIDTELSLKFEDWKESFMSILIHYYKKYLDEGIYEPEEVLACTKEYQKDNDTIKNFIHERIEQSEGSFMSQTELYTDFKYWYKDSGEPMKNIPNKKNVVKYMVKELSNPTVNNGQNGWLNYQLVTVNMIDMDDVL